MYAKELGYSSRINILYILVYLSLLFLFLSFLLPPITTIFHETDLWWEIPTISHISKDIPSLKALRVLFFDPNPTHDGEPMLNTFFFFVLSVFGFKTQYFIFVSLVLHVCCSLLLYLVVRKIGLNFYIAYFTALIYTTLFLHFYCYFWPMATQHLINVFFALAVLYLYLETTRRIDTNINWRGYFRLTLLVNFLATFCPIAILILPASILVHILVCSKDESDTIRKYGIWLPLFLTYLGYPLIRLIYFGYPILERYLHATIMQVQNLALFPVIFILGVGSLLYFRFLLKSRFRYHFGKFIRNLFIVAVILYLFLFLWAYGKKELLSPFHQRRVILADFLSPYNFLRPFIGALISFLNPIKVALGIDSAKTYYYVTIQSGTFSILLSLGLISIFIKKFLMKHKGLIIFLVLYAISLPNMWRQGISIPSRYFIYITPFFSVLFSSVFIYLYTLIVKKTNLKKNIKQIFLFLIFVGLCIPNIFAIRLALFRGRLVNTFLIYDYLKISDSLKHDIYNIGIHKTIEPSKVYISAILPMPFKEYWDFSPVDPLEFHTFRYTFTQANNNDSMFKVNVNRLPKGTKGELIYTVKNGQVFNSSGDNIDTFVKDFTDALRELESGDYEKAGIYFQNAIKRKPFLFNYVLGLYPLEDTKWLTNGRGMRDWIDDIISHYNSWTDYPIAKTRYISDILHKEIDDYIECLFYASYLKYVSKRLEESRSLFSQIRFLNHNYNDVASRLANRPIVQSNKQMIDFLNNTIIGGYNYRNDKRNFLEFILKLALNNDIII